MAFTSPKNLNKQGKQRFVVYLLLAAVILGIAVATLISLGVLTEEGFNSWVVLVGLTVPALLGIVSNILALFNIEKAPDQQPVEMSQGGPDDFTPRHAAPEDQYDPSLGGKPKNQV